MNFMDAVEHVFTHYAVFEGRARRSEFWYFQLFHFVVVFVLGALSFTGFLATLLGLYMLASLIPNIAVCWRRFHDIGKSGAWYFISFIPIEGPCRGTDYRIHTGYNYIGRETGDICIHGDNTISAERDANVTYVPQIKKYFIAHELGKNVLLVNDMPVIGGSVELHNYDVITVGTTKLLFMGLCGEQFSWSDKERSHD